MMLVSGHSCVIYSLWMLNVLSIYGTGMIEQQMNECVCLFISVYLCCSMSYNLLINNWWCADQGGDGWLLGLSQVHLWCVWIHVPTPTVHAP